MKFSSCYRQSRSHQSVRVHVCVCVCVYVCEKGTVITMSSIWNRGKSELDLRQVIPCPRLSVSHLLKWWQCHLPHSHWLLGWHNMHKAASTVTGWLWTKLSSILPPPPAKHRQSSVHLGGAELSGHRPAGASEAGFPAQGNTWAGEPSLSCIFKRFNVQDKGILSPGSRLFHQHLPL